MSDPVATPAASPTAPSATPSAGPQPAQATPVAPASPAASPATPTPSSEPPKERWEDILTNARKKTRAEVENEYRQKYAHYDEFEQDPWSAIQKWMDKAQNHSVYGPIVNKWAQERFKPPQQQIGEEPQPDVPVTDGQGNVTNYVYSAKQLKDWHKWNSLRQAQELDARFGKLEQQSQEVQTHYARMQAKEWAMGELESFRRLPYFKEHEADVHQALDEHPQWGDNLHAAYNHVLVTKILPTLTQAERAKALDDLNHKAAGNTVTPGQPAPAKPQFKNFKDAAEYYSKHPEEAEAAARRG